MTKYFMKNSPGFRSVFARISGRGFLCFLLLIPVLLSGCGTIAKLDKSQSDMMPKSVAISIFEKHGSKEWAEKPFLFTKGVKEYVGFFEINHARYVPLEKKLQFWNFGSFVFIPDVYTEEQALELANAARALGATNIQELTYMY